jgi:hypothetical protein
MWHKSMMSCASMSLYGEVINSGSNDPFKYGQDLINNGLMMKQWQLLTSTSVKSGFQQTATYPVSISALPCSHM